MGSKSQLKRIEITAQKEFITMEDGYVYYFPSGRGGLSAAALRDLADILDKRMLTGTSK